MRENESWTRANIADGTWTLNDPDSTLSSITNTGGINQVIVNTTNNNEIVTGGVHYTELLNPDGTSIDFGDRPVSVQVYVHWPNTGWYTTDSDGNGTDASGGNDRPGRGSRCYTVAGIMTDPENLPATGGAAEHPIDLLGYGLRSITDTTRGARFGLWNDSSGGTYGSLNTISSTTPTTEYTNYAAGRKWVNRMVWWCRIAKHDKSNGSGLNVAGEPQVNEFSYSFRWDNGDKHTEDGEQIVNARFGRVRTDKLYFWIANGRANTGAGSSVTIDFDVYYKITVLDDGNNPSGRTGL